MLLNGEEMVVAWYEPKFCHFCGSKGIANISNTLNMICWAMFQVCLVFGLGFGM